LPVPVLARGIGLVQKSVKIAPAGARVGTASANRRVKNLFFNVPFVVLLG
jgi:hypothetical protein